MRSPVSALALALALALSTPAQAAPPKARGGAAAPRPAAPAKENYGLGIGAVIGGLLGGPPGAVLGAAGGAWIGSREAKRDKAHTALQDELAQTRSRLAAVSGELARSQAAARDRKLSLEQLQRGVSFDVYFRTDDASIEPELRRQLAGLAHTLRSYPSVAVELGGYADRRGTPAYNRRLSERRATAVRAVLMRAGIAASRIRTRAFGASRATAALGDREGYVFDRRVTLRLSAPAGASLAKD